MTSSTLALLSLIALILGVIAIALALYGTFIFLTLWRQNRKKEVNREK